MEVTPIDEAFGASIVNFDRAPALRPSWQLTDNGSWPHAMPVMAKSNYFDELGNAGEETAGKRGGKKRATARRIFMSAIELMQEDGFNGVSIEQICKRAEIARATFFQHFASKAALLSVFSDIVRQRIEEELAQEELAPEDQLRLIADHLQRLNDELGAIAPDMLAAFMAEPGVGFNVEDPETGVEHIIVEIVQKGQSDGRFTDQWTPEDIAISLISSWIGVARHRMIHPGGRKEKPLHKILDLFLTSLEPRE